MKKVITKRKQSYVFNCVDHTFARLLALRQHYFRKFEKLQSIFYPFIQKLLSFNDDMDHSVLEHVLNL